MLAPRWRKVLRDLWYAKTRTLLVVLSIAVGVFAFSMIYGARDIILREMDRSYRSISPVSATLTIGEFNQDLVDAIVKRPDIAAAQGRRTISARVLNGPETWQSINIVALPDDAMTIEILKPVKGAWPPPDKTMVLEKSARTAYATDLGHSLLLDLPHGNNRQVPVNGIVQDLSIVSAATGGTGYAYISLDTLEWFNEPRTFNQLQLRVANHPESKAAIWDTIRAVQKQLFDAGYIVQQIDVPTPLQSPTANVAPTILLVLTALGALSLLLSGFLIINTITAILSQQTRQIGVMKSIGAGTKQILELYLAMSLAFGVIAVVISVPLGWLGAYGFATFLSGQLNFDIASALIAPQIIAIEIGIGLLVPVVAGIVPIFGAARQSVRAALDAVSGPAPHAAATTGWLVWLRRRWGVLSSAVLGVLRLSRPLLLSLRNTFRRRGRLARTLSALVLAGGMFIGTLLLSASVTQSLADSFSARRYDATVTLGKSYSAARVAAEALQVPGVGTVETWQLVTGRPVHSSSELGDAINITGLSAATPMLVPEILSGRWLLPEDERALVVSSNFLTNKEPGLKIGDLVSLTLSKNGVRWQDEVSQWRIVGVSQEFAGPNSPSVAYVPIKALERVYGDVGYGSSMRIAFTETGRAAPQQVADGLAAQFAAAGIDISKIQTNAEQLGDSKTAFSTLSTVLSALAVLMCVVGGLGLTGTMGINVLERTREIGVMRAIGASNGAIYQIIIAEGLMIGVISWFLGALASVPLGIVLCQVMGFALLNTPLSFTFSWSGVFIWLGIMLVVAVVASISPARRAVRLTVREVLAYDG